MTENRNDDAPRVGPEDFPHGVLVEVAPRLRRLIAPNPSAFTYTGTCSYIVGEGEVAILDPGPESDAHLAALLEAVSRERVAYIVVTHTHRDHSTLAGRLRQATGAPIVGARPHTPLPGAPQGLDASHDLAYAPDQVLADGERIGFGGSALVALHTPGHAANHLAFVIEGENAIFSGDHVMGWSTSIVAPPDGSMSDYMASLEKMRAREEETYWPGHGGPVRDPRRYVRGLIAHRRQREAAILARLETGEATIPDIVAKNYIGVDPRLHGAAGLSTLAHIEDLIARGLVARGEGAPLVAPYRLV